MKQAKKCEKMIQIGAFVAGIAAGAAIAFVIVPVGMTLVIGLVVAGTAAVIIDKASQDIVGNIYDLLY